MAVIKCKMCGGDIELATDKTFGTCEYCGSTMTLPKVSDDQRAAAFNRGNHFRRIGEFDKALAVYERIVQEDDADAEAHWCCALCRFGIEYVEDPATYEWLPTCHRASFDNFLEDVDYLAAVEYSDGITRRQYQKDAAKIAEVQRGILATSRNEEPFDVFLCYKETDENSQRTKDSILAQDIYYQLTEQGRRVFFARITLEDKVGTEYEPYIFAALNSAKVMIALGTRPEHFNAVWVKNEWSRFLSLMKKDRSKLLLPCYRDMDPYDLPEQLSVLQSYDMGKIGFLQDLTHGVNKVLDAGKAPEPVKETVVVQQQSTGGANLSALLKRGNMALEDMDWENAKKYFDQVLNLDAECAAAYIGLFLANARAESFLMYEVRAASVRNPRTVTITDAKPDEAHIQEMIKAYAVPKYLPKSTIRSRYNYSNFTFESQLQGYQEQLEEKRKRLNSDPNWNRAQKFATGELKEEIAWRIELIESQVLKAIEKAQEEDAKKREEILEAYKTFLKETDEKVMRESHQAAKKLEQEYQSLSQRMENSSATISELQQIMEAFLKLESYKNCQQYAEQCSRRICALEEAAKVAEEKRRNRNIKILLCSLAAGIALLLLITQVIVPAIHYKTAEALLAEGKPAQAALSFDEAENYRDAEKRAAECWAIGTTRENISAGYVHTVALKFDGTVVAVGSNSWGQCNVSNWTDIVAISARSIYTVGLKSDGTVVAVGDNEDGQCNVTDWTDIKHPSITPEQQAAMEEVRVAKQAAEVAAYAEAEKIVRSGDTVKAAIVFGKAGNYQDAKNLSMKYWNGIADRDAVSTGWRHTVALKSNGTAVAVGDNYYGQCDVSSWTDIVAVSASYEHTVGLKSDGTVVAVGSSAWGRCSVSGWADIVAVSAGAGHTVGLKSDGTVVAVGDNDDGECNVHRWTDIVAICAGAGHTVGLKSDGTVVAVGDNDNGECNVRGWTDIVAISAGRDYSVGLKSDGTVVAVGYNYYGQCDVSGWTDIVAVSAGYDHTVGLKSDGTVVAVGDNHNGECNVRGWTDIVAISAGRDYSVGLKSDGTVVAVGDNDNGECNVTGWRNIKLPNKS